MYCTKLKKEAQGLDYQPLPSELGKRIQREISAEAWDLWLGHQTILINEYRLNLLEPESRTFLTAELEKFLFGDGAEKPKAYTPATNE